MKTLFFIILMLSGILMTISILLMSPKGGLGLGIGGASAGGGDYGSQKTVESSLKKTAIASTIVFVISTMIYPYI